MDPKSIVDKMMQLDAYSQWMGIQVLHIDFGTCKLSCTISAEMLNGFGITHGGISYALADSALAFASNSHGQQCVSIETSISHIKPAQLNDILTAVCTEIQKGKTIARYVVDITNQHNELIARFNGTVFRSEKTW
ncbi:MAG: hotdog fold thioesterase [Bacteroidota bacterium]